MIPLVKTFMPPREELMPQLEQVLYSGYISQGNTVDLFEKKFCKYIGSEFAVSVNSGSSALHIALILAGVKNGDEVITTPITAEPTNTVILQTGAKIVWADIDDETGNMCPTDAEAKITSRTKAIVVVDYSGIPVDIEGFKQIENKYNIPIIEDAAHALGASFEGTKIGNHFNFSVFSFQAIKHMTTVDGGMLCLKSEELYERAKLIRWFGLDKRIARADNDITIQGYKYHMNNINAQIGLVQLNFISDVINKHIDNGQFFDSEISETDKVRKLRYYPHSEPSYWLYTLKVKNRDSFIEHLARNGITASELHKRNDTNSIFRKFKVTLPNVDLFSETMVHIPCGWWITLEQRRQIVDCVESFS